MRDIKSNRYNYYDISIYETYKSIQTSSFQYSPVMTTKTEMFHETYFPNYFQMVVDVYQTGVFNLNGFNLDVLHYPSIFKEDLMRYTYVSSKEIVCVCIFGVIFSCFRYVLTVLLFQVKFFLLMLSFNHVSRCLNSKGTNLFIIQTRQGSVLGPLLFTL